MKIFEDYAFFYDSLYQDRNYDKECDFLEMVFAKFSARKINSILDLGCGTGRHTIILSERGYNLVGVDQSERMLSEARRKSFKKKFSIDFVKADIRDVDIKRKFDAIILMFAVLSYQTTNSDVQAVFKTIKKHLKPNGIFFFDCWFGPSVFSERATDRIKKINYGNGEIIRIAQPILDIMKNLVTVNYTVLKIHANQLLNMTKESHRLRFFFPQEICLFACEASLKILKICPFMSLNKKLSFSDWNIAVIGTA